MLKSEEPAYGTLQALILRTAASAIRRIRNRFGYRDQPSLRTVDDVGGLRKGLVSGAGEPNEGSGTGAGDVAEFVGQPYADRRMHIEPP